MRILRNTSDRLLASLTFFTRLPLWRLRSVPQEAYAHVTDFWPIVGWMTGGTSALVFLALSACLPPHVALLAAIASRILLTGALHEDGLADFCDGMGGGTTRERTLEIMKDSHIGTYGVLGLIVYVLLIYMVGTGLYDRLHADPFMPHPTALFLAATLTADVWGKASASRLVNQLPYARTEATAKAHVVYKSRTGMATITHALRILIALAPGLALAAWAGLSPAFTLKAWLLIVPFAAALCAEWLIMRYMKRRLKGYTGDCCGATFLLSELAFLLTALAIMA